MESAGPSMNMQAEVNGVHVNFVGLRRISYKCVEKEVEGIKNAKRLDRAFEEIHRSVTRLKALGVFTDVSAHLTGGVGPNSMGVNMIFEEKLPKREFSIRIDESGRPGIEGSFSQPAFLGNLQGLELSAGAMGRQDTELQAQWSFPKILGRHFPSDLRFFVTHRDFSVPSSFKEALKGAAFSLRSPDRAHTFTYTAVLRDLLPVTGGVRRASNEVLHSRMRTAKSALTYAYVRDRIGKVPVPREGSFIGLKAEVAGLGGDARHLKASADVERVWLLSNELDMVLNLTGSLGAAVPLKGAGAPAISAAPDRERVHLQDRFFIGGVSSYFTALRGFASRRVGPTSQCRIAEEPESTHAERIKAKRFDHVGGEAFAAATATVSAPLPYLGSVGGSGPRMFVSASAGNVLPQLNRDNVRAFLPSARVSLGVGISMPLPVGTFEFSYGLPLKASSSDDKDNWQFALRVRSIGGD